MSTVELSSLGRLDAVIALKVAIVRLYERLDRTLDVAEYQERLKELAFDKRQQLRSDEGFSGQIHGLFRSPTSDEKCSSNFEIEFGVFCAS